MTATMPTCPPTINTLELINGKVVEFISNEAIEAEYVPVIDVSRMYSSDLADRQALAKEIGNAARNIGFLTIVNHGIDMTLAADVLDQAKLFFALDKQKKMDVYTGLLPDDEYIGYHPMYEYNVHGKRYQDLYEAFNWNYEPTSSLNGDLPYDTNVSDVPDVSGDVTELSHPINLWPADMPTFRRTLAAYQEAMVGLARRMTRLFALALQLPETAFDQHVRSPEASMRILHYPVQSASRDDQNGLGAHTDVEYFTIIMQDRDGLEVLDRASRRWVKVAPVRGAFVVNIADCFMRQTNDAFLSTVHRVINTTNDVPRYSCPFFFGFNRATIMDPIPSCVGPANPHKYPVITAGEYYHWRTQRQKERGLGVRVRRSVATEG